MFARIIFLSTLLPLATSALAKSSQEVRAERAVVLLAEPISFTPYPGGGLRAGLLLTDRLTLEAAYTSAFSNLWGSSRYLFSQVDFLARVYLGNSFNLSAGLGYRQIRVNFGQGGSGDNEFEGVEGRAGSVGTRVSIGNRWQLGRFTLGCDWAGFFLPLAKIAEETTGDEGLTASQQESVGNELDHQADLFGPSFLRLQLGMAF